MPWPTFWKRRRDDGQELDEFWTLIESGVEDPEVVRRAIRDMSEQELVDFYDRYDEAVVELSGEEHMEGIGREAGYCSEDHAADVADSIVRLGKRTYDFHLAHPEQMPADDFEYEGYSYESMVVMVYDARYGGAVVRRPDEPVPAEWIAFWELVDNGGEPDDPDDFARRAQDRADELVKYRSYSQEAAHRAVQAGSRAYQAALNSRDTPSPNA